jgi:hypothetical protein
MKQRLPIVPLNKHERIFLQDVYERNFAGERFTFKGVWGKLHKQLPQDFRPEYIDGRLVTRNGEEITVMGVVALQKSRTVLKKIDKVVAEIWSIILQNTSTEQVEFSQVNTNTGLSIQEISFHFKLAGHYARLWRGGSYVDNTLQMQNIVIGGDMEIFHAYKEYPGIENLILVKELTESRRQLERFNFTEIMEVSGGLDQFKAWLLQHAADERNNLIEHQRITMHVLAEEIEELKEMLPGTPKKLFFETVAGKILTKGFDKMVLNTIFEKIKLLTLPYIKTAFRQLMDHF